MFIKSNNQKIQMKVYFSNWILILQLIIGFAITFWHTIAFWYKAVWSTCRTTEDEKWLGTLNLLRSKDYKKKYLYFNVFTIVHLSKSFNFQVLDKKTTQLLKFLVVKTSVYSCKNSYTSKQKHHFERNHVFYSRKT